MAWRFGNNKVRRCLALVALLGFALQPLAASLHLTLEEHTWWPGSHSRNTLASHYGHHHDHGPSHHHHGPESGDSDSRFGGTSHEPHPIQDHDVNNEVAPLGSGSSPNKSQPPLFAVLPDSGGSELPSGVRSQREMPPDQRHSSAHSGSLPARAPPALIS